MPNSQREDEFSTKHNKAIQEALAGREGEVVTLRILATSPEKQGRGYASALVRIVTDIVSACLASRPTTDFCGQQADAQGRATSLISSNLANSAFYNSLGLVEKAQIILGDDNPTWIEPPITLLVVRLRVLQ